MGTNQVNCLDFRRQILADPRRLSVEAAGHRGVCPACAEFSSGIQRLESELDEAVRVPVPDGLADRVLLNHRLGKVRARSWLALAASLLLAISVAVSLSLVSGEKNVALAAIDHVLNEEPAEISAGRSGDQTLLASVLAHTGVSLPRDVLQIRYEGRCPFGGSSAYHIVLGTPFGKATLLLMPEKLLVSRVVSSGRGLSAVAAPARRGSYAIIAGSAADLAQIEKLLK